MGKSNRFLRRKLFCKWSEAFVYDARNNITQRTDARGVKTNFNYQISGAPDPLNRLQSISYDASTADTTYTINAAAAVTMEYMTTGDKTRVKKVTTSGIATEENAFDTEGRISQYKLTMTSRSSYPFTTDYTYDTANRLTQVTYPAQYGMAGSPRKTVTPSYDQASRLTQLNVNGSTQLSDISYNTASQTTQLKTGAATSYPRIERYTYDGQTGLLTGQTVKNTSGTTTYLDLGYSYARGNSYGSASGKTGQLTHITNNLDRNRDHGFEFDAIGRLKKATGGGASGAPFDVATWTQNYSYDRYGNKTGVTSTGVTDDSAPIPTDGLPSVSVDATTNRMTTASGWSYDNAGNVVRGQNSSGVWQRFEYDAAGRLVKIKDDSNNVIETYTYGADRSRLKTETSTGRTYYAWGGRSVIAEYTEASAATSPEYSKCYIYAGSRLLMTATKASSSTETQEFQHPDRLGTKLMTNAATGTTLEQSTLPFGTPIPAESSGYSNQLFTSYDRSASTGLDYAVNRTYSSGQGRFTQVDPIGMSSATVGNPRSNNLYAYTQNMPTDFTDPSGLMMIAFVYTTCEWAPDGEHRICHQHVYFMDTGGGSDFSNISDWREDFGGAVNRVRAILNTKNACSDFFKNTTSAVNALTAFASRAERGVLDNMNTGIRQISDAKDPTSIYDENGNSYDIKSGKPAAYIEYGRVIVNGQGPFLSKFGKARIGGYPDGSFQSQVLQILHELAHIVLDAKGHPLIKPDGSGSGVSSEGNTEIVKKACKKEIEASKRQ